MRLLPRLSLILNRFQRASGIGCKQQALRFKGRVSMVTSKRKVAGQAKGKTQDEALEIKALAEPKPKLTDIAYERLEEAIITLKLPPGSIVSELTLSQMFEIGRTPIREAIQRLAREHLMLVLPQRGLLIPELDMPKQLRLIETRREIERLICRSAARRATPWKRPPRMMKSVLSGRIGV